MRDKISLDSEWTIYKYDTPESLEIGEPDEVSTFRDNIFQNQGIENLWLLAIGSTATNYGSSNAYIGVGDGTVAATASDAGLKGTNTCYMGMDSPYPYTVNQGTCRFYSTFGTGDANFAWEEFTVSNAADNTGDNINRKVSSQGTKAAGSTWELRVDLIIS